jgi:hypothetical protein
MSIPDTSCQKMTHNRGLISAGSDVQNEAKHSFVECSACGLRFKSSEVPT